MAASKKNWIAGATSNAHGQFKAKAQKAGMGTEAYAEKMKAAPGKTGKQARLAVTLMGMGSHPAAHKSASRYDHMVPSRSKKG